MPQLGPMEIIIVLAIALIVFGPKRLPELGRGLGRGMRDFKAGLTGADEDERRAEEVEKEKRTTAATISPAAPVPVTTQPAPPVEVGAMTDDVRDADSRR